ncbi:putative membrane protein [Rhodopirellula maiorica SM1]|uniref:Putative membrane protein n=1 Tax=Rhodopirellula maiorica SM1 TaxID=1265738 RepID=M5RW34_9BACT|nr:MgtC/SapB family protein [Rhodopirellula maiorica]EMI18164.1 putative membrane protein [Rhodopirellula maiorica SM1]
MNLEVYQAIALSLGLGLLVGLQRQWSESEIAGIRTFPLITLLGTFCGLLGEHASAENHLGWLVAAGLIAVAIVLAIANVAKITAGEFDFGMTTEMAALLMFVVGVAVGVGMYGPAIVTSGIAAVLLHWKKRLHAMVVRMGENEIRSVIHLALIGLVILPVLPNETFGPYDVLNPYSIWRMVVLIVGISMVAYIAFKLVGPRAGAVLGGILGGLISSTATTVSYARQAKSSPDASAMAALVIVIASTIVNVRVLFEIGVVAPGLLRVAALPLLAMLLLMTVECVVLFIPLRKQATEPPKHDNPAQLKPAIVFGVLYAVILFIVAAAKDLFGSGALYGIAMISGLTDVDAITLSTAKLFNDGRVDDSTAWRVILIATMSNLVFKAGVVAFLGNKRLLWYVALLFGIAMLGGGALLAFWEEVPLEIPAEWFEPEANTDSGSSG